MRDMLDIFSALNASYHLSEGSLLNFHRNHSTGDADIDFSVEMGWWMRGNNSEMLKYKMENAGMKRNLTFGEFGEVGDVKMNLYLS